MATAKSAAAKKANAAVRAYAFGLPEAWEDHPWGETVAKVGKKVFAFLGHGDSGFSVKLPQSGAEALTMSFVTPTGYGLGARGWVSVTIDASNVPPVEMLCEWILESYRAVAPKTLVKQLDAGAPVPAKTKKPVKKKAAKKRAAR